MSSGTLIDSSFSTTEKKFGNSALHLPVDKSNARVVLDPVLDLGGTDRVATFTISAWFRNLYSVGNYRTLSRGETNGNHLIVQNTSNRVGVYAHNNGDWIGSGTFNLEPDGLWHNIAVVSDSSTSKFYLDGFFRGESDRATGDKIKTIGNTNNGGQRFAEYLDEFRVYGIALTDFEVEKIYRESGGSLLAVGEGNYSVSVWVKPDSLLVTPVYDFAFGWYEGGGGEYMQARMSQGDITDYNQLDYFNPGDTLQKTVLEGFVTERLFNGSFNDVQLDDIDYGHIAQTAALDISTYPNIVLWLDASDTSTIVTGTGNEIETWTDKIDSTIKLISHTTNKPDTNSSINGLNAIEFDKRSQNNTEYMFAQKSGVNWSPANADGSLGGKLEDIVLYMAGRIDTVRRTNFPFGFGWRDHFPWNNTRVFWRHESSRPTFILGGNGTTFVLTMVHSKTVGKQIAYLNGSKVFDGPRTNDNHLGDIGTFGFPTASNTAWGNMGSTGWGADWTVGEFIVSRGIETDQDRLEVESYLGKKWGVLMSYGFAKRTDWVYEDTKFEQAINFAGAAVNERSLSTGPNKTTTGVGTGTNNIGGLWMGKLRVGNQGYIRTGKVTFGTRSDDGSVFWIDLDEDGDFSRSGAYGDEMVVDNKGGHGQQNRTGTRFLGRQSPLFMQAGVIAHKGFALGADGYQLSKHPTFQEEKSTLSSTSMVQGQWHHIVMVVDRDAGRLKQYLNGNLVAEDSFTAGTEGEYSLGDWFIGGMPASNDRFTGLIDDARIYSIALSDRDISKIYNNHGGDMGIVADFVSPSITDDSNISIQLNFLKFDETIAVERF
jgi:hypothetical protein